ncbi:PEP-CTERM sorting domain-containing protein [Geomonas anaerohicana]|uniref:PEP-CTERM sorting domain-containing protein n=1 Tax=Geomonas anaerohicana TaxID=2798583 RepID=A0ABS0YGB5_9BACT|nr:PEP-CTERM sorting domain-containing protein [Geomonas anaerohicana]MBJ6751362.1 PEP-CTERM sorting domain-containing protein [Geomonas anaerohicana]
MKQQLSCVVAAMALLATVDAGATTLNYYLDQNNSTLTGGPWATVTLSDDADDGRVHFTVDLLKAGYDSVGPNFGLQDFYFNENTGDPNFAKDFIVQFSSPTTWTNQYSPTSDLGGVGPYGKFELSDDGTGNDRTTHLDFYLRSLAGALSAEEFAVTSPSTTYMFAGHIGGFSDVGSDGLTYDSAQFASSGMPVAPIPEPGTMTLLGAGFFALAVRSKRRKPA